MAATFTGDYITDQWRNGTTLPAEACVQFSLPPQEITNDTGVNVLVDLAHQCNFTTMWKLKDVLNSLGYRYIGCHACLDTVLTPGSPSRIRICTGKTEDGRAIRPFAMWPNAEYNVIVTMQSDMRAQPFLPEELAAVDSFVKEGGGLVICAGMTAKPDLKADPEAYTGWPLRTLVRHFGADVATEVEAVAGSFMFSLSPGDWEVVKLGDSGKPVACRKTHGKGRIVLLSSTTLALWSVHYDKEHSADEEKEREQFLSECLAWASQGKKPVGGDPCLPDTYGGGGSIYPEIEVRLGKFVIYYTKNQKPEVLETVNTDYPRIRTLLYEWLPSIEPEEPMYILLASGQGGGWAVNAFFPKENGIASYDRVGLIGIFAHELAHTMAGPWNAKGKCAGRSPHGVQGEAHAGWLQGKIWALFCDRLNQPVRDCNCVFDMEKANGAKFDIAVKDTWWKEWWIWQKLDDKYGTTWFTRWYWVRATRWMDEPDHEETWDEMVEDMSIAVGEDLFPWFKKFGTTLVRDRLEQIEFQGETLKLPVAQIDDGPAGNVRLEPIGDYTKPI